MKYPKEYLDEIKLRLKVSQVVGKFVKLKKRGKEFIGLSPFSNEKTPSFTVSDEKGFYHCFSSGEHGNIFDFLMKVKNYKFGESVKTLAGEAGMPPYRFTKQDEEKENRWKIYKSILTISGLIIIFAGLKIFMNLSITSTTLLKWFGLNFPHNFFAK